MVLGIAAIFYLLGSIPIAWILGSVFAWDDIRTLGSGNAGVMNIALSVSRKVGLLAFVGEIAKGVLTVLFARALKLDDGLIALAVVMAVVGTRWSIWIQGAGGRGNTLGVAAMLVLSWPSVAFSLVLWLVIRTITRRAFIATRIWIISIPLILGLVTQSWIYASMGAALSLIYLSGHKRSTDDHTILKENWPSLWAFLVSPSRKKDLSH
jgi:glycerol-3-phosphate acyltransferase PlsY